MSWSTLAGQGAAWASHRLARGRWPWRRLAWGVVFAVGLLQVVARRFLVGPDALSYLDRADAWRAAFADQGAWSDAISAYWSPFQSWWLALLLGLTRPAPPWESTIVHLGQLVVLAVCLRAFETFWSELCEPATGAVGGRPAESVPGPPAELLWATGYGLFAVTILGWVTVWELTPDLWAATWLFLQATFLLRLLRAGELATGWRLGGWLGVWSGLACLTKMAMLPVAVMGCVGLLLVTHRRRRLLTSLAMATMTAALLVVPWALLLSHGLGRPTLGETGRLNYAWYVGGAFGGGQHWQGESWPADEASGPGVAGQGRALHPTRRLWDDPPVFEYATPVAGTYPPWYDPVYWHEGITLRLDLGRQGRVAAHHLAIYGELAGRHGGALLAWLMVVTLLAGRGRGAGSGVRWRQAVLLALLALGPLAMYALVHVELRFLAAFGVFLGAAMVSLVRWPEGVRERRWAGWTVLAGLAALVAPTVWDQGALVLKQRAALVGLDGLESHQAWQAARALRAAGLGGSLAQRTPLASIGYSMEAYWARLAGARLVADIYRRDDQPALARSDERLWGLDAEGRRQILMRLASSGARAVVARQPPLAVVREGWSRLGTSDYFVLPLPPPPLRPSGAIASREGAR